MPFRQLTQIAVWIFAFAFVPATAPQATERNQVDFVYVGIQPNVQGGKNSFDNWHSFLQSELANLPQIDEYYSLTQTQDGKYLLDIKVRKNYSDDSLSAAGSSQAFNGNQFFQIIENFPITDGIMQTWRGNIYVENKLYDKQSPVKSFSFEDQISPVTRRNILTIIKLISIQALIENAVADSKPAMIVCGLYSVSVNFSGTLAKQKADGVSFSDDEMATIKEVKDRIEADVGNANCPRAKLVQQ